MLIGFDPIVFAGAVKGGRPARLPSHRMRNLAWLRHLLRSLDDVAHWAGASVPPVPIPEGASPPPPPPPKPAGWAARPADAALIGRSFAARAKALPEDGRRGPTLLDEVLGPLFSGAEGEGGRYFSDAVLRGQMSPDPARIQRLDELIPGSRAAFEQLPPGVDAWFYDALDFSNPWVAKLFLWRAMDPALADPGWDELLAEGGTFADPVRDLRFAPYTVSGADVSAFDAIIDHAAALTAYPGIAYAPVEEHHAAIASVIDAAAGANEEATLALTQEMERLDTGRQWAALSNAIAARRLSGMLDAGRDTTAWWLRAVRQSLSPALREIEEARYGRFRTALSPLDGLVEKLL